jgi:phosphate starvation-inducible protein PhoH
VVRHKLVQRIVAAYDEHGNRERAARAEHGPTPGT